MSRRPVTPNRDVKLTSRLRLLADPPERDPRGRILNAAQAKEAQRLRMEQADIARMAAAAAMLPGRLPNRDRQEAASEANPPVTRDSKGDRYTEFEAPAPRIKH